MKNFLRFLFYFALNLKNFNPIPLRNHRFACYRRQRIVSTEHREGAGQMRTVKNAAKGD